MAIDVLGIGAVAVDDLLFLSEFPRPDSKMAIERHERHAGGLAGTALVAAQRMGRSCAYAGTLGEDELSRFILDGFAAEGVSVRHLVRRAGCPPSIRRSSSTREPRRARSSTTARASSAPTPSSLLKT